MNPPDKFRVFDMIVAAAERQLATTAPAKAIIAAGLEHELRSLITQIAANAADPIALAIEDALTPPRSTTADHQPVPGSEPAAG